MRLFTKQFSMMTGCCRSSFSDFASKFAKDERYRGVDKVRDKEDLFKDFVSELRRKEKDESRMLKDKVRTSVVRFSPQRWPARGCRAGRLVDTYTISHKCASYYVQLGVVG